MVLDKTLVHFQTNHTKTGIKPTPFQTTLRRPAENRPPASAASDIADKQECGGVFVLGVVQEFGCVIEAFSQQPARGVVCAQRRVQIKENSPIIIPDP